MIRKVLLTAIQGRGTFRRFKDALHHHVVEKRWYEHRDAAYRAVAAAFLESEAISYVDNDRKSGEGGMP